MQHTVIGLMKLIKCTLWFFLIPTKTQKRPKFHCYSLFPLYLQPSRFSKHSNWNWTIKAECSDKQDRETVRCLGDESISNLKGFGNFIQEFKAREHFSNDNLGWQRGNIIDTFTYVDQPILGLCIVTCESQSIEVSDSLQYVLIEYI